MGTSALLPETIGEYRVTGFLGAGGMGEVYQAVHARLGRTVAVKVLTNTDRSAGFVERFLNEARIQASLHHPNIATLYDFFEFGGRPCIIMEYVDGQTVAARIAALGRMPVGEAMAVLRAVVDAIAYVHGHGVVHRDVKAHNVKISSKGEVKLLDFGIARTRSTPGLTRAGAVVGTPEYLSPEQIHGQTADAKSDIWALGVLLYEMVTGRVPFAGASMAELYRQIDEADYPPPARLGVGLPEEVEALIARCLQRRPADRFASAREMLLYIDQYLGATPAVRLRPAPPPWQALKRYVQPRRGWRPSLKLPALPRAGALLTQYGKALTFGLVALLLMVFVFYVVMPTPPKPPPRRPPAEEPSLHAFIIDVVGPPADVYRGRERLGQTPYTLRERIGTTVELTLRRAGYRDKHLRFDVTPTTTGYTENLEPAYNPGQ